MTILQAITPLPASPDRLTDTEEEFSIKALNSLDAQAQMVTEENQWATECNQTQAEINASEANIATMIATLPDGSIDDTVIASDKVYSSEKSTTSFPNTISTIQDLAAFVAPTGDHSVYIADQDRYLSYDSLALKTTHDGITVFDKSVDLTLWGTDPATYTSANVGTGVYEDAKTKRSGVVKAIHAGIKAEQDMLIPFGLVCNNLAFKALTFGKGRFLLSALKKFTRGNFRVEGVNFVQPWSKPSDFDRADDDVTELVIDHLGDGIQLTDTTLATLTTTSNIRFKNITFSGKSTTTRSNSCFLWDVGGSARFSRGFVFENCAWRWFKTRFAFTQSAVTAGNTTQKQVGDIQELGCSANFNDELIDCGSISDNVQINKLAMKHNDWSNNTTIGRVTTFSGSIMDNIMEGHNDTLEIINSRNFRVGSNHFEANTGEFIIKTSGDCRHGRIGVNYYGAITAKRKVWIDGGYDVQSEDPFIFNQMYGNNAPNSLKFDDTGASDRSFGLMANLARPLVNSVNGNVSRQTSANHRRVSGSSTTQTDTILSSERVLLESYTTAGAGSYDKSTKTFAANIGNFVGVTFLMRRDNTSALDPYVQFKINDSLDTLKGSWESPLNNFTKTILERDDTDEILVTVFAKCLEAATNIDVVIYPYGVSPAAGLVTRFSAFEYHTTANVNDLQHSLNLDILNTGDAAPTAGVFAVGDYVVNRNPSAGGADRWRNVVAGSPGTWKALTLDA